ncbi:hypothetical protein CsSME_00017566 [Camellia sinensis var. sinensis]
MLFLPWIMARGHMIPVIDAARIFAAHGAKLFQKPIEGDQSLGHDISSHTFKLPTAEFGLPDGCENLLHGSVGMMEKIYLAVQKLQEPIQQLRHVPSLDRPSRCSPRHSQDLVLCTGLTFGGTHRTIRQILIQRPLLCRVSPTTTLFLRRKEHHSGLRIKELVGDNFLTWL